MDVLQGIIGCQKAAFSLPEDIHYLNCATMSPNTRAVEAAGMEAILRTSRPHEILQEHFFDTAEVVKERFARLVHCAPDRVALIPSVSYGMATVVKNLRRRSNSRQKIVVVGEEFPSDVYAWDELIQECGAQLHTVKAPDTFEQRGRRWNEQLLEAIDNNTLAVCLTPAHWSDGTLFDLQAVSERCRQQGALFVVDGTQFVGAAPFDLQQVQPDFMVCAAYKWLLGPYGSALAYLGPWFDDGVPLEQTWTGRLGSQEFKNLVHYQSEYRPGVARFNMGEFSNFIQLPMLAAALQHLLDWTPEAIRQYASALTAPYLSRLENAGYWLEQPEYRAQHLFGLRPVAGQSLEEIRAALLRAGVYVSYRGPAIRVSVHLWNEAEDMERLTAVLEGASGR